MIKIISYIEPLIKVRLKTRIRAQMKFLKLAKLSLFNVLLLLLSRNIWSLLVTLLYTKI